MPSRIAGTTKTATGNAQSRIGRLFGFHGRAAANKQKAILGHGERHAANTQGWGKGTGQRIRGIGHSMAGAITGNRARQSKGNAMNNVGQIRQNFNSAI